MYISLEKEELYWLELTLGGDYSPKALQRLKRSFGSLTRAVEVAAREAEPGDFPMLSKKWDSLKKASSLCLAADMQKKCENLQIGILTPASSGYPTQLGQIFDPPGVLFWCGNAAVLKSAMVAVIGSRNCSGYGAKSACEIGRCLAAGDVTVVSGMARGIDRYAHEGALLAGGRTVAVLGCGVDQCYPPEHTGLRDRIRENGVLVSEFPPGTQAKAWHFPKRNRIISGLCESVIVVEAGEKSGSLITAECALEQNRDVYCVPGSILSRANIGAHRLIQQGAGVLGSLEEITILGGSVQQNQPVVNCEERWLWNLIQDFGNTAEELCQMSGQSPEKVQQAITMLQVNGQIQIGTDGRIIKTCNTAFI